MQQLNKQVKLPDPTRIHKEGWRFSECLGVQEGITARGTTKCPCARWQNFISL